jgi:hypothetical protein
MHKPVQDLDAQLAAAIADLNKSIASKAVLMNGILNKRRDRYSVLGEEMAQETQAMQVRKENRQKSNNPLYNILLSLCTWSQIDQKWPD